MERFEESTAWQSARELVKCLYEMTRHEPCWSDWGLCDQIQRAAVPTMSNITEGFERGTTKEFIQFLYQSKGSVGDVRSLLYVALDVGYISQQEFESTTRLCTNVSVKTSNLISYLKRTPLTGKKFA